MLKISIRNILRHKLRNALTIIGIAIGIGLVIALGSIGAGLTKSMESAFEGSAEIIDVSSTMGEGISEEMIEKISYIEGVEKVIPISYYQSSFDSGQSFMGINIGTVFTAVNPDDQEYIIGPEIFTDRGRKLEEEDENKFVTIVGFKISDRTGLDVGDEIYYDDGTSFEIIGVIEKTGKNIDDFVIVPLKTMLETEEEKNVRRVVVKATSVEVAESVAEDINLEIDGVSAFSYKALARQVGGALSTLNLAVMGIGAVSAMVAGLMITVVMIMSVTERRKEIGIMKAIGATEGMILKQVLQESGIIGLVGGILGIIVGWFGAVLMNIIFNFPATVTLWLVVIGMGSALILGIGAGLYPAWSASRLDPIEVLRYG